MSRITEKNDQLRIWSGMIAIAAVGLLMGVPAILMSAAVLQGMGISIGMAIGALVIAYFAVPIFGDGAAKVLSRLGQRKTLAEEKADKMGTAIGLKWQVRPERRRWVTSDTPDPEQEPEQPQVLSLPRNEDA